MSSVDLVEVFVDPSGPEIIEVMSPGPPGPPGVGSAPIAAGTLLGNNTGGTAMPSGLTASQVRTLLGLATDSSPTFSGLTLTGLQSFSGTSSVGLRLKSLTSVQYGLLIPGTGDLFVDSTTDRIDARLSRGAVELIDSAGGQTINGLLTLGGPLIVSTSTTGAVANSLYAVANTLRYRDSTNTERLLLNATDNLANLANTNTALTNLAGGSTATGTGGLVRATSPMLTTPNIGAATGTSLTVTDVSLVRGGTGFWRVLADNGFAVRNAANNADSPISCAQITATQLTVNANSGIIGTIYGNATDNYLLIGKTGVPAQSALIGNSDSGGMGSHVFFTISGRPTSDFRVLANGNVLVGATSDTGQKFQVTGNTLVSSTLTVGSTLISPLVVLGSGGPVIKNVSGTHTFRNSPDNADAPILCGNVTATANGAASTPATTLTGTWFTGGTATTTKPQLLVEPTGTTSTNWSTSGTGLGINAASGFGGDLINAQIASSNIFRVSSGSVVSASFFRDSGNQANYFGGGINARNTWLVAYSNDGTDFGTKDLSYSRNAAGVLQIGNGTANASGSLLLTNLTASGNLICSTVGMGLQVKTGTGAKAGNATLVAGTVTVTNTTVTANTVIYLTRKTASGTIGTSLSYTVSAGASFTINSQSILETSVISYFLVEVNP